MVGRFATGLISTVFVLMTLTGCKSFDGEKVRREHARDYPQALAQTTERALAERGPLGLEDCIRLALEHSLETRSAEIEQRIARLDRKIAFANFLPSVKVDYMHYEFDPEIHLEIGDTAAFEPVGEIGGHGALRRLRTVRPAFVSVGVIGVVLPRPGIRRTVRAHTPRSIGC